MTPVTQTKVVVKNSKGETIIHGNCYPAIIATMLNLPITEVPNTEVFFDTSFDYKWLMNAWMREKFKMKVEWAEEYEIFHLEFEEGCRTDKEANDKRIDLSGDEYLAYGQSPRGVSHICVYQQGELVHDPHPTREGLVTIEGFMKIVPLVEGESTFANPDIQSRIYELSKENAKLKAELAAAPPAPIEQEKKELLPACGCTSGEDCNGDCLVPVWVAKRILAIRDALVAGDTDEAYHWLYQIASPEYAKNYADVWRDFEERTGYKKPCTHTAKEEGAPAEPEGAGEVPEEIPFGVCTSIYKMWEKNTQGFFFPPYQAGAIDMYKSTRADLSAACKRIEEQPHEILDRLYQELLAAKLLTPEIKVIYHKHVNSYMK
jgi:hypothetical protein